jgi:2Fe-2S ferredoxin
MFESLDAAEDEEEDMLDLAFALTNTSRLACQIHLDSRWQGATVKLPKATRNMYVDKL